MPWVHPRHTLAVLSLLVFAAPAWAQTGTGGAGGTGGGTGTPTQGLGSCSGMITGTVGLAVPDGSGGFTSVQPNSVPYAFNEAECACTPSSSSEQIQLQIKLTATLPRTYVNATELWVGTGCDNYTTRYSTATAACQKVATLDTTQFTQASTVGANGILVALPGNALASPVLHQCNVARASNSAYIFINPTSMTPDATCILNLTEANLGPTAPTGFQALSGDTAITLTWTAPPTTGTSPYQYQILCSDDAGNPIQGNPPAALYSTCVNGVLRRRTLPTGGSLGTGTGDGGTTMSIEPTSSRADGPHPAQAPLQDMSSSDMAGALIDMGAADMAMNPVTFGPLASLDPKYVCSNQIGATATSQRISGLVNNKNYHFVVLAIDQFGNATPTPDVTGTPHAVEDLYRRYRDKGGAAGSCFIATAAFGSYESGWVQVLRQFRDEVLLPTDLGHDFVEWYYAHSPPLAAWIARHAVARAVVRVLLLPFIAFAAAWLHTAPWQKAMIMLFVLAWLFRRRLAAAWRGGAA